MITPKQQTELIEGALSVRARAYAPYSEYAVGAVVFTASGRMFDGVNVENAAYPLSMCAERTAIFKAVSEGERDFAAIVVATQNGGSPCGACRQVMAEFGLNTRVITVDASGEVVLDTTVRELLPDAFQPDDLQR
jgi:cytidine deaminase